MSKILFQIVFYAILLYLTFSIFVIEYSVSKSYGKNLWTALIASRVSDLCSETVRAVSSSTECYAVNFCHFLSGDSPYKITINLFFLILFLFSNIFDSVFYCEWIFSFVLL